jgi:methyl-accepting chemotaxis protein
MRILDLKIGTRLGGGFVFILVMMAALIGISLAQFTKIDALNSDIIEKDWVKAEAANAINATTRANARRTLELLIAPDAASAAKIREHITANKALIDEALKTLDVLVIRPEGKALLANIKTLRGKYVASFTEVAKLIAEDKRDEAINKLREETMPALDALQAPITELAALQKKIVATSSAEAKGGIANARKLMAAMGVLAAIVGLAFAWWITRSITVPLNEAVQIARTVASGDLTSHIDASAKDETGQLLKALKDMNDSLVRIVAQVRNGTDTIATASGQIATGNLDLSSRTEQQAGSLEETASSMEELTSTVAQNADNARQANQLAASASEVAQKGGQVVSQVVDTMGSINESAKKIVDIIGVIDGIAFQTNILALNAAVEAARAGEQGRGFAVVASEVRNLAQRSAGAAKEIKALIGDSVGKVEAGTRLVDEAGSTMGDIVASITRVTDIMSEITAASSEQRDGIEQINQAITQMDEVTQQNAALVEEAAAAADSLQEQAAHLADVVGVFKLAAGHAAMAVAPARRSTPVRAVPVRAPVASKVIAPAPKQAIATARAGDDWEEF